MPASYTHIYFGLKVYEVLDQDIKDIINNNKKYYMMGLYGPDPLFFYKAYKRNNINDYGDTIHSQDAYNFFNNARDIISKAKDKDPYIAYICGFMNHYILDSEVHSYINKCESEYKVSHAKIESDLDRYLLVSQGYKASSTSYTNHIYTDKHVAKVMSELLDVDIKTMHKTIKHMKLFLNAFHCPNQHKKKLVETVLESLKLKSIQDMIIVDEADSRCEISSQVLYSMIECSINISAMNIKNYYSLLFTSDKLNERLHQNFL